jgi:hypothetical protein
MKQIFTIFLFLNLGRLASAQSLNAGVDQTITAGQNVQLNGQALATNIRWFTNGSGTFNNRNILNAVYYPSAVDINNGEVKLTLVNRRKPSKRDFMKVTILPNCPTPLVNAGSDIVQCGYSYGEVQLNATIENNNGNGMLWTTSGFGYFEDDTNPTTTYYYDQTDVNSAFINLTATALSNVGCPEISDQLSLHLQEAPYLEFPNPFIYAYSDNPVLYLSVYRYGYASSGSWTSSGNGTFDDATSDYPAYTASEQDINNGYLTFTYTANDPDGPCGSTSGTMDAYIEVVCPSISVNAGEDIVECGYGFGAVALNAIIDNNGNGMEWSTSGFGFFDDPYSPSTTYYYDQTDVNYAFINLIATAFSELNCAPVSDDLLLNLQAAPYLEFPEPFVYAYSNNPVLYVSVYRYGYASSGTWTSSGSGIFDDPTSDYTAYTASQQDINNGGITFTYTTNDPNGPCGSTSGSMEGYIYYVPVCPAVSIFPASDTICGSDFGGVYDVFANITGSDYFVQWTSDGQGFFFDENNASTSYEYSSGDAGFGGVTLTCTVYDNSGYCPSVSASFYLKLNDPARINLDDFGINACGSEPVYIDGNLSGFASTVYWSTSGTGTFSPNPGASTQYFPSLQDRINGSVGISGTTNDPAGPCGAASDYTEISFTGPYVEAGSDIVVCGYPYGGSIPLNAILGSNTYNTIWSTDGFGNFDDELNPNTNYNYDGTDVDYAFINLTITASGFGICPDVSDVVTVNLQAAPYLEFPEPVVYANSDNPILYVSVYRYGYASSGTWTSSGTGYFSDPTSDYSAYYASQDDINNGSLFFTFTTNDPAGPCGAVSGYMEGYIYYIATCPTVSFAATSDAICGYDFGGGYDLSAIITGTDYYTIWTTTGSGYLYDDPNNPSNIYYEYSPGDVGSFGITITCSVYDNAGYCAANTATFSLGIDDPARIDLSDFGYYACGDQGVSIDNPISGTATTVYWTTSGTGYFSPNPSSSTQYFPSFQDRFYAGVSITGTTNDPVGVCPLANDFSDIFLNGGVVDAGADIVECGYEYGGSIPLNATLGYNAYNVIWTTSGTGYFDDEFSTSTNYNYDANDVNNASIYLTATVTGNGCPDYSDAVILNLQAAPSLVFPEPFVYTCDYNPVFGVNVYRYGYASSGMWTSNGFGYFDSPSSDYTNYFPSPEDVVNGSVVLTFTTNDPDGSCIAASGDVLGFISNCGGGGGDLIKNNSAIESTKSIKIFPNPTNGFVKIISELDIDYSNTFITDLTGKTIYCNWEAKNLNVSMLQTGIYFLHVKSGNGMEVLKFTKQ